MEKFKFVDLGESKPAGVLCQSSVTVENKGIEQALVLSLGDDGLMAMSFADNETAGLSEDADDYPCFAHKLSAGVSKKVLIASLRSLADELEKTLDATQS